MKHYLMTTEIGLLQGHREDWSKRRCKIRCSPVIIPVQIPVQQPAESDSHEVARNDISPCTTRAYANRCDDLQSPAKIISGGQDSNPQPVTRHLISSRITQFPKLVAAPNDLRKLPKPGLYRGLSNKVQRIAPIFLHHSASCYTRILRYFAVISNDSVPTVPSSLKSARLLYTLNMKDRLSKEDQQKFVRIFKEMSDAFDKLENGLFKRLGNQSRIRREIHRLGGKFGLG